LITNRKDGILIRSDDANEFAREALGLLANPGQAAALASSARETIQKDYSKEDMCQRMIGEYKSAIDAELNHNT
jgi:glycosyltransferase involved in cell wall biosynthesis